VRRRAVPAQVATVAASLLVCSLLIGVGSALALRPAALTPGIVGSSPSPPASPAPDATPSPVTTPRASPGGAS
jgi:hypothetical protein